MRRMTWIAVGATAAVLGGSSLLPFAPGRLLLENVALALLGLAATAVLYVNFPTPARAAVRGELRRGRPALGIARRHRWAVDAVRAMAETEPAAGASRTTGRLFRFSGRPRRPRLGVAGARLA